MEERLRGIGEMSRESGLTVSALRFYDAAGVLGPAHVDPASGYRFYAPDQLVVARLVATLRRAGMPLPGIRAVLDHRGAPAAVDALLVAHVRRLEQGLSDARRALSSVRSLLEPEENPMPTTCTVPGPDLAAALRAVRFAAGSDPDLPVLAGVLMDLGPDALTLVATDRYRMAIATLPVDAVDGPATGVVVPLPLVDRLAALAAGPVTITVDGDEVAVGSAAGSARGAGVAGEYPDYRRVLATGTVEGIPVDATQVRKRVGVGGTRTMRREQDGTDHEITVLRARDGNLEFGTDAGPDGVGVNAEFLLEALDAGGPGQLSISLDGPVTPLVVRSPRSVSLLMPVRV